MLEYKDLLQLAKTVARANPQKAVAYSYNNENFSYDELQKSLRKELQPYAGNYRLYNKNKDLIFELIEETINDILPKRVIEQYGQFAEVRNLPQGAKAIFTQKITESSRRRARQFVTKVGLAGKYEVFKLDSSSLELQMSAFGGAAQIGFEEFLDGRVDFADLTEIIMDGLDDCVYLEIERALKASIDNIQATNKHTDTKFDEARMDSLISVASAYGTPVIYCTREFAATMLPQEKYVSNEMKNTLWQKGYLGDYKGVQVIVLEQSFEDETNAKKTIDPAYAWIIPTGANKPIKIAFEGGTLIDEWKNHDWSREIQVYKKFGVGAMISNNICVYKNTQLSTDTLHD